MLKVVIAFFLELEYMDRFLLDCTRDIGFEAQPLSGNFIDRDRRFCGN